MFIDRWYGKVFVGALLIYGGYDTWRRLTAVEETGASDHIWNLIVTLYWIGGKWLPTMLFSVGGSLLVAFGVRQKLRERQES